jgi:hypothetical protein
MCSVFPRAHTAPRTFVSKSSRERSTLPVSGMEFLPPDGSKAHWFFEVTNPFKSSWLALATTAMATGTPIAAYIVTTHACSATPRYKGLFLAEHGQTELSGKRIASLATVLVAAAVSLPAHGTNIAGQWTAGIENVFVSDNASAGVSCFVSKPPVNAGEDPIWAPWCSPAHAISSRSRPMTRC